MVRLRIAVAIIQRGDEVLIARRSLDQHLGGLWEFPGGKIEDGETNEQALVRECREELGLEISPTSLFYEQQFEYPERGVHLYFYLCWSQGGRPRAIESDEVRWIKICDLNDYNFPEANQKVLELLMEN
ncbi:MAG: 8-oxo-dGTP diphosphatase MutT [Planctomycetota bacterium]|nr:8-oxo-dGTP diphosphatase MutT [Planctomycetota bacterium]